MTERQQAAATAVTQASDKPALASKKFKAWAIASSLWHATLIYVLTPYADESITEFVRLCIAICCGVIDVGYILGQAGLDAFLGWANAAIARVPMPHAPAPPEQQ